MGLERTTGSPQMKYTQASGMAVCLMGMEPSTEKINTKVTSPTG